MINRLIMNLIFQSARDYNYSDKLFIILVFINILIIILVVIIALLILLIINLFLKMFYILLLLLFIILPFKHFVQYVYHIL